MIRCRSITLGWLFAAAWMAGTASTTALGQGVAPGPPSVAAPSAGYHLTLDEVKSLALSRSKDLDLGRLHMEELRHARGAAKADYFPKILSNVMYFHFSDNLGKVVALPSGRRGLFGGPQQLNVLNQNATLGSITVAQPITPLVKVYQAVKLARAEEEIAAAQFDQGTRKLLAGVEQLYYGVFALQKARGAALAGVGAAEQSWNATKSMEARATLLETQQELLTAGKQLDDLAEQLNALLGLPPDAELDLAEPPPSTVAVPSAEEAVCMALASSPEVREAAQTVEKARAGLNVAKAAFLPEINVFGSYFNQQAASYVQTNIGAMGVQGSWTIYEFGKRSHTVRMREMQVAEAHRALQIAQDKVTQATQKAYRELTQAQQALGIAAELAELRRQGESAAKAPAAVQAAQAANAKAQGDLLQADIAQRLALGQLMSLIGPTWAPSPGPTTPAFRLSGPGGPGHDHGH